MEAFESTLLPFVQLGIVFDLSKIIFTGRNEVLAKVIFSQACVILFTGGCLLQISEGGVCSKFLGGCLLQILGGSGPGGSNFRNAVNVRPVRILLECILVYRLLLHEFEKCLTTRTGSLP